MVKARRHGRIFLYSLRYVFVTMSLGMGLGCGEKQMLTSSQHRSLGETDRQPESGLPAAPEDQPLTSSDATELVSLTSAEAQARIPVHRVTVEATIRSLTKIDECPEWPVPGSPSECPLTTKPPIPIDSATVRIDRVVTPAPGRAVARGQQYTGRFTYSSRPAKVRFLHENTPQPVVQAASDGPPTTPTEKPYIPQEFILGEGRFYIYNVFPSIPRNEITLPGTFEGQAIRAELVFTGSTVAIGSYQRIASPNDLNMAIVSITPPAKIKVGTGRIQSQFRNVSPHSCCEFEVEVKARRRSGVESPGVNLRTTYACTKAIPGFAPNETRTFIGVLNFAAPGIYDIDVRGRCLLPSEFSLTDNSGKTVITVEN